MWDAPVPSSEGGDVKLAHRRLWLPLAVAALLLAASTVAGARVHKETTLVFGTAADPVVLDGALVSDGESLRVIDQMFEGLVNL
jgi:ABC-type oligopeptide transport system substrate-binding subunit